MKKVMLYIAGGACAAALALAAGCAQPGAPSESAPAAPSPSAAVPAPVEPASADAAPGNGLLLDLGDGSPAVVMEADGDAGYQYGAEGTPGAFYLYDAADRYVLSGNLVATAYEGASAYEDTLAMCKALAEGDFGPGVETDDFGCSCTRYADEEGDFYYWVVEVGGGAIVSVYGLDAESAPADVTFGLADAEQQQAEAEESR